MKSYDSVVILGYRPTNPDTWEFPSHIYHSLDRAAELYQNGEAGFISLSGKWTINFDALHISQPFTEAGAMAEYLEEKGIPRAALLTETDSQDSISNFYYLKREVFEPHALRRLHFIAASARLARIKFLGERILGPTYTLSFEGVDYKEGEVSPNEERTRIKQARFLAPMADGQDSWLDGKFYNDPFYRLVRMRAKQRAHLEPFIHLAKQL